MIDKDRKWLEDRINYKEISKYMKDGKDFINDPEIEEKIKSNKNPDPKRIKDIIAKSLTIHNLEPDELAALINVTHKDLISEMEEAATAVKKWVYDNRIVTFAPLYLSNLCLNNCLYCGLRCSNQQIQRKTLSDEDIINEVSYLAGKVGHKRLIVVYGEHPEASVDYMQKSIETIYKVKVKTRKGFGQIRRLNVNGPPLLLDEFKKMNDVGIGTYQIFQETYHHETYNIVHPGGTLKGDYDWRLYSMHRALESGIDDVGLGALFGLYDWKFEIMGLLYHSIELENLFGIGPHTISFPRLEPAENTPFITDPEYQKYHVSDDDFKRLVVLLRLAVPHSGMIITARESPEIRRALLPLGCTQTDASSCISIGSYSEDGKQDGCKQQFLLGDTRSLDEIIRELAQLGFITSFCTAGYRCGRTGQNIMALLRTGQEGKFCKLNAVLTFKEWLDDFASEETYKIGINLIEKEMEEIRKKTPNAYDAFIVAYNKISNGERDLYF